jgi:hypothetical protein
MVLGSSSLAKAEPKKRKSKRKGTTSFMVTGADQSFFESAINLDEVQFMSREEKNLGQQLLRGRCAESGPGACVADADLCLPRNQICNRRPNR